MAEAMHTAAPGAPSPLPPLPREGGSADGRAGARAEGGGHGFAFSDRRLANQSRRLESSRSKPRSFGR